MKKSLLLITDGFPFDESDRSFLEMEFKELTQHFDVSILANSDSDELVCELPSQVSAWRYEWKKVNPVSLILQLKHKEVRSDIRNSWCSAGVGGKIRRMLRILAYSLRAEQLKPQIQKIVEEKQVDLIYTYWCTQATVASIRLKQLFPELRVAARFHGFDLYKERAAENWQPLRPFIAQNSSLLIFVCKKGENYFREQWPGPWSERTVVGYIGTKAMKRVCAPAREKLVVVSCSNLIALKRVDLIVRGLSLLPDDLAVEWDHFGDGDQREELERLAAELLGKKSNVSWKFWGQLPCEEVGPAYQAVQPDLFVMTSSTEGLPVSVQEAMAMGVPTAATDVGGMQELVDHEISGYLLPENVTAEMLCQTLTGFWKLPAEKRKAMGQAAYEHWETQLQAEVNARAITQRLLKL